MTGNREPGNPNRFNRRSPAGRPVERDSVRPKPPAQRQRGLNLPKVPPPPRSAQRSRPHPPPPLYGDDPWESDEFQGFNQGFSDLPLPNASQASGAQSQASLAGASQTETSQAGIPQSGRQQSLNMRAQSLDSAPHQLLDTDVITEPGFYDSDEPGVNRGSELRSSLSTKLHQLSRNWAFWSLLSLGCVGTVAVVSAMSLFRIPGLPNCPAIFWPTAPAATRIQCAEAYAEEGSVDSLLSAIELVNSLPEDHPLRLEINERIESWAERILDIADDTFHQGDIDNAIKIARRIPESTAAGGLVDSQVDSWLEIWSSAEEIYKTVEDLLRQQKFREAFSTAIQLLSVGNTYWETTKYEEVTQLITTARQDLAQLAKARSLIRKGTVDSILEGIDLIREIEPESYLYAEAQRLLKETADDMLDLAQTALDRRDAAQALVVLGKIPASANLQAEIADFRIIVEAHQRAWQGTVSDLEAAILRVQSIGRDRPLYSRTQPLISRWRLESQGITQLARARQIADPGTVTDLSAAILEANNIARSNPLWDEAQEQINSWQAQIETIEDQPLLDRANAIAIAGDSASLQAAITEAQRIRQGRALYREAQDNIQGWRNQIQRREDQPMLAQARQLASTGNYQLAIATAGQINSNRALYQEAQTDIANWRSQIEGAQQLQEAYRIAQSGTPNGLTQAIAIAAEVSPNSPTQGDAAAAINRWSWELLSMAEAQARSDLNSAIALVQQVPSRTEAYASAQLRLQEWQQQLGPTAEPAVNSTPETLGQ
ncbi:MAG: chromosome segregation ATPase [Cyanobacteria bacterium J06642_9]